MTDSFAIIDAHVHLWDQVDGFWDGRQTSNRKTRNGWIRVGDTRYPMMPPSFRDSRSTVERLLQTMDTHGIEKAVVLQEWLDGNQDDYLSRCRMKHPERLRVLSLMPFEFSDGVEVYIQHFRKSGMNGVLYSHRALERHPDFRLDDPSLNPLWNELSEQRLPLVLKLSPGIRQLTEIEQVVGKFPNLVMVIAHLGLPHMNGWKDQVRLARLPNVFLDTGGLTAFFRDEGYPFPSAQEAVRYAVHTAGAEKIMWGSDYPRTIVRITYRQTMDWLSQVLDPKAQKLIFGETARNVYRWEKE